MAPDAALGRIRAPVLGLYGGEDANLRATRKAWPRTVEFLRQAMGV